jgi:hypothetical protein
MIHYAAESAFHVRASVAYFLFEWYICQPGDNAERSANLKLTIDLEQSNLSKTEHGSGMA